MHIRFTIYDLSKLFTYKSCYKKLQTYFGENNLKINYIETNSIVMSFETDDLVTDLKAISRKIRYVQFSNLKNNPDIYDERKESLQNQSGSPKFT